ncbi:hypothetical protein JQ596_13810 [Bradyrhizobium manausense]|uniref:hypothetical protein n=1 Tax=Bradyrhizobium TaxID=374 RepID=UPI001BA6624C|nr:MULTISPECIES: hypothetical protein [Bradyrhizobium]MBR0826619.1 hypothetical protein [Bradyrhizobium manausense]UVO29008.1 hypothetical protein KUF59_42445 [Bradyrhizobium arachidis]
MKPYLIASILVMTLASTPALAAPPTVTPSPGYDRRLQESRSATTSTPATVNPSVTHRKSTKKKPAN